jgi:hypothetical protein
LKINQLQVRKENALLLISSTVISAVQVVVTITSRQINVLWVYTIIITELVLKGYIQFQKYATKISHFILLPPFNYNLPPPGITDHSTLMHLYSTMVLASL